VPNLKDLFGWAQAGIRPQDRQRWRDAGFTKEAALRWVKVVPLDQAIACRDAGLTPSRTRSLATTGQLASVLGPAGDEIRT
jgi:hypothetical protein